MDELHSQDEIRILRKIGGSVRERMSVKLRAARLNSKPLSYREAKAT